ncbi:acyl-CoA synthetase [Microbispora sp. RL4-1S]|uniref:Acyl-CoA synthetase n=1 Tax=Microbispora oryzae TaxID=2806554 RepID=A0A941AIA0_9ACTN|nr:acyl-CoA synthetase [Microbispora oryzae]MBP2702943.1 acyl-CoA synthetase [Microbispora oryzae]
MSRLWPRYEGPDDLAAIERLPLEARGLPESTYALLARAAALWPSRTAITVLPEASRWREPLHRTYAELLAEVHRYANLLHRLGVRRGDVVALMSPNCAELIPATLAAQLAGIAAPLNGGLSPAQLTQLLGRSGARVLITAGPELSPEMWARVGELDGLDAVLALRPTGATGTPEPLPAINGVLIGHLAEMAADEDPDAFAADLPTRTDLAAFFHTGGTTGNPKLAAHTQAAQVANAWMLAADARISAEAVVCAALPLFHVNALVVTLLAPLFRGAQVVWAGPLGYREPGLFEEFWKIVEHFRITAMSAVPTVYSVLAQCPVNADISSLRHAMVGAAPLPVAVRETFQRHTGVALVEGYGLTEGTCATARSFPCAPRHGAVGQRLPYQRVAVVRPGTWEELPYGETGVLTISGPNVFAGYVTGRNASGHILDGLGKLNGGRLDTGDLARLDPDGFIHLAGRAKDLIIRGGHNIDPAVIEDALLAHPQVMAASAVGRPDAHAGEVPVAYVALAPGATLTEEDLCAWAAEHVPERAAAPRAVTVLDVLPVTAVGKPYKLPLRADAVRRAVVETLAALEVGAEVTVATDDDAVAVTVTVSPELTLDAVRAALDQYSVRWSVEARP